ncbi:unnamed protein product, partial [Darwinula stevensoni]
AYHFAFDSTVSSGLNSLAAITLEDFVRPYCFKGITSKQAANASKVISLAYGLVSFGLVFVVERFGTGVLTAALSIFGMIGGPLLGLFTLGMFFPWANNKGSLIGGILGFIFVFWIGVGANVAAATGRLSFPQKPLSVEGCLYLNATEAPMPSSTLSPDLEPLGLYRLSYLWYSTVGCWSVIAIGLVVSWATGMQDPRKLNPNLVSPIFHYLRKKLPEDLVSKLKLDIGDDYDPLSAGTAGLVNSSRVSTGTNFAGETNVACEPDMDKVLDEKNIFKTKEQIGLNVIDASDA